MTPLGPSDDILLYIVSRGLYIAEPECHRVKHRSRKDELLFPVTLLGLLLITCLRGAWALMNKPQACYVMIAMLNISGIKQHLSSLFYIIDTIGREGNLICSMAPFIRLFIFKIYFRQTHVAVLTVNQQQTH